MRLIDLMVSWFEETKIDLEIERAIKTPMMYVYRIQPGRTQMERYIASISDNIDHIAIWNGAREPRIDIALDFRKPSFFDEFKSAIELCLDIANKEEWQ